MSNDLAQIQAAINAATYRLDELEKTAATPIGELKTDQQALLNKVNVLEIALHQNSDSLRNDLINKAHTINEIKSEFKKELDLIKGQILEFKNDAENINVIISDILKGLQDEIRQTVTKEFISELYKKDNK